jgi:hypothetical protein
MSARELRPELAFALLSLIWTSTTIPLHPGIS